MPHKTPVPTFNQKDHLHQAIDDILQILKNPTQTIPSFLAGDNTKNAIRLVAEILNKNMQQSSTKDYINPELQEKIASYYNL